MGPVAVCCRGPVEPLAGTLAEVTGTSGGQPCYLPVPKTGRVRRVRVLARGNPERVHALFGTTPNPPVQVPEFSVHHPAGPPRLGQRTNGKGAGYVPQGNRTVMGGDGRGDRDRADPVRLRWHPPRSGIASDGQRTVPIDPDTHRADQSDRYPRRQNQTGKATPTGRTGTRPSRRPVGAGTGSDGSGAPPGARWHG